MKTKSSETIKKIINSIFKKKIILLEVGERRGLQKGVNYFLFGSVAPSSSYSYPGSENSV